MIKFFECSNEHKEMIKKVVIKCDEALLQQI